MSPTPPGSPDPGSHPAAADAGVAAARFRRLGVPDEHVLLGPPAALYAHYQLDAAGVESVARQLLAR